MFRFASCSIVSDYGYCAFTLLYQLVFFLMLIWYWNLSLQHHIMMDWFLQTCTIISKFSWQKTTCLICLCLAKIRGQLKPVELDCAHVLTGWLFTLGRIQQYLWILSMGHISDIYVLTLSRQAKWMNALPLAKSESLRIQICKCFQYQNLNRLDTYIYIQYMDSAYSSAIGAAIEVPSLFRIVQL